MKNRNTTATAKKTTVALTHGRRNESCWTQGTATVGTAVLRFEVKHFDAGSVWGIKGGCISKLWIADENGTVANFDRGWDVRPATAGAKAVFAALVARFNSPSADKAGASL